MTHDTPPKRIWAFDRYVNGILMAEGVEIEKAETFEQAAKAAVRLASSGPKGEAPVLVLRDTSEADAMVAAALRGAADLADTTFSGSGTDAAMVIRHAILASIPQPASAALDKLIAEAVNAEQDRVTRIAASLFPGGYDNNRIKIEDRLSEIAANAALEAKVAGLVEAAEDAEYDLLQWLECSKSLTPAGFNMDGTADVTAKLTAALSHIKRGKTNG